MNAGQGVPRITAWTGAVIGLLWASASLAQESARPAPAHVEAVDAAGLYGDACSPCHGRLGDGQGSGAHLLGVAQPRDFTAGVFKFRTTPTGSLPTDEDLFRTISEGVPGTWMPSWEDLLSEDQRWALIRYVKGFSEFFVEEDPDPAVTIPRERESTPELVAEGRLVYAALKCAQCHGPLGRGDGPSADELTDDWDRTIVPYDFTRGGYKNGEAPVDVYRTLVTGLNGTPMPAFERSIVLFPGGRAVEIGSMSEGLDAETVQDLRAYIDRQPSADRIAAMPEAEAQRLAEGRLWALVHHLQSLNRPRGWFHRLFKGNPELDTGRRGR